MDKKLKEFLSLFRDHEEYNNKYCVSLNELMESPTSIDLGEMVKEMGLRVLVYWNETPERDYGGFACDEYGSLTSDYLDYIIENNKEISEKESKKPGYPNILWDYTFIREGFFKYLANKYRHYDLFIYLC